MNLIQHGLRGQHLYRAWGAADASALAATAKAAEVEA